MFLACKNNKEVGFISVAIGYGEDVNIPRQAVEINELGELYYYTDAPILDSFHFYKGKIDVVEAKWIINYIGDNMQCMSTMDTLKWSHYSKVELFFSARNDKVGKHGYGYFDDCISGDSISKYLEVYKTSKKLEPIHHYNFQTAIQNEELPTPPPLLTK
ncbi:hypothetical protein [Dyadobacter sp. CY343]|uniref:hypothetical protein n=1 Tax=Dyadobacter sp. CY343 TaxID=2907299 RepID=UPI001F289F7F|nr:hypothetical protein [Dyadobacter sp. CY343]MCE7061980.1 hypothetical protein [Dyadobacter sp. CY343]